MSPEHDAFGRPTRPAPSGWGPSTGSSPSGGLGGGSGGSGGRPPSGRRLLVAFLVFDVIVVAIVGAVLLLANSGGSGSSEGGTTAIVDGGPGAPKDDGSMLGAKGTREAFAKLRGAMRPGERVGMLSIRPDYLSATVATGKDQPARSLTVRKGEDDVMESSGGTSSDRGVPIGEVDLDAPAKLIAATRRGIGPSSPATIDYLVFIGGREEGQPAQWAAYLKGGRSEDSRWQGDAHGDHVVRPSDGAPAPPEGQSGPAERPFGLSSGSMIRGRNLRRALAAVRPLVGGSSRVTSVSVWPQRVIVATRQRWVERRFTVDAAFGVDRDKPGETAARGGLSFSSIDVGGPERAIDLVGRRAKTDAKGRIDYVILDPADSAFPGDRTTWSLYLRGGNPATRYWRATLDGRRVGRPGQPGAP
ncbi:hypothetical protein PAI11_09030 [Patulibacter medicamentivorans]|uniref:Uncharacterized protein n=1 Tax=Patulibacter medicamentivorans TaxID=1097667 RepID=H0E290_9ACTN|nr:hypothetical protein [Patulibacter medicamentivorans]EHN12227.1 hypothetical protein PAI11_09030 [Patulibacter medicamentivorans]